MVSSATVTGSPLVPSPDTGSLVATEARPPPLPEAVPAPAAKYKNTFQLGTPAITLIVMVTSPVDDPP